MAFRDGLKAIAKTIRAAGAFSVAFFAWMVFDGSEPNYKDFFLVTAAILGLSWQERWLCQLFDMPRTT